MGVGLGVSQVAVGGGGESTGWLLSCMERPAASGLTQRGTSGVSKDIKTRVLHPNRHHNLPASCGVVQG